MSSRKEQATDQFLLNSQYMSIIYINTIFNNSLSLKPVLMSVSKSNTLLLVSISSLLLGLLRISLKARDIFILSRNHPIKHK